MAQPDAARPADNRLLAALPVEARVRLGADLEPVELAQGKVIAEVGRRLTHALFPTSGVVSITVPMRDGRTAEAGVVGREGMFGVALVLGADRLPARAVVQIPGAALRLPAKALRHELARGEAGRDVLLLHAQAAIVQLTVGSACNALHDINRRLARWLLMCHDRVDGDEIALTHEYLAQMLGVQRAGVTLALGALQAAELVGRSRGKITILNRAGLERAACECYRLVVDEVERLFGG